MAVFKCKMCGGQLEIVAGESVVTCEYCGTKQTAPLFTEDSERLLYESGNNYLNHSEYDKAENVFNQLLTIKPDAAELYWDLVLCKYGVTYVKDPKTDKYIPTCNRTHFESVFHDENYKKAIVLATEEKKAFFEEVASTLDAIQKGILSIFKKEKPFDIFISYKETDAEGRRTKESINAQRLYEKLTESGYKVFFSRITLEKKAGTEYEPYIYAALYSSKVMLTVSSCRENLDAPWVHNEWSRFLTLRQKDNTKTLIPLYFDMEKDDLPPEFALFSSQNMQGEDFEQELFRGIKKLIPTPITKAEKRKKLFISLGATFAACAAIVSVLLFAVFPKLEADRIREAEERRLLNLYTEAVAQFDEKNYEKALSSFRVLGDYKDSKKKIEELEKELIPYAAAQKLYEENKMEEAAAAFEAIGDYKNSKVLAQEIREKGIPYADAEKLYYDGNYPEAAWAFKTIGDYKDAVEWQKKAELSWRKKLISPVSASSDSNHEVLEGYFYISANGTPTADANCNGNIYNFFDTSLIASHGKVLSFSGEGILFEDGTVVKSDSSVAYEHVVKFCNHAETDYVLFADGKMQINEDGDIEQWENVIDFSIAYDSGGGVLALKADGTLVATKQLYETNQLQQFQNIKEAKISQSADSVTFLDHNGDVYISKQGSVEKMNLSGVCKLASATCAIKNNGDAVVVETGKKIAEDCIFGDDIYTHDSLRGQETAVVLISKNGTIYACEIQHFNVTSTTCESLSGKTKVYDEWLLGMK